MGLFYKGGYMKPALLAVNIVMLLASFVAFIAVVAMPNPSVADIRFVSIFFITALVGFLVTIEED